MPSITSLFDTSLLRMKKTEWVIRTAGEQDPDEPLSDTPNSGDDRLSYPVDLEALENTLGDQLVFSRERFQEIKILMEQAMDNPSNLLTATDIHGKRRCIWNNKIFPTPPGKFEMTPSYLSYVQLSDQWRPPYSDWRPPYSDIGDLQDLHRFNGGLKAKVPVFLGVSLIADDDSDQSSNIDEDEGKGDDLSKADKVMEDPKNDKKNDENKSDENKSYENKSDENKSYENKSDENKSDENRNDENDVDNDVLGELKKVDDDTPPPSPTPGTRAYFTKLVRDFNALWRPSHSALLLQEKFSDAADKSVQIKKIVCIGFGALKSSKYNKPPSKQENGDVALQHFAAITIARTLNENYKDIYGKTEPIQIILQDPAYTEVDRSIWDNYYDHINIVKDPEGFLAIDKNTLVMSACLIHQVPLMQICADICPEGAAGFIWDKIDLKERRVYRMQERGSPRVVRMLKHGDYQHTNFFEHEVEQENVEQVTRTKPYWLWQMDWFLKAREKPIDVDQTPQLLCLLQALSNAVDRPGREDADKFRLEQFRDAWNHLYDEQERLKTENKDWERLNASVNQG